MTRLTIGQARQQQRMHEILDKHVVSLDDDGFTIAHTQAERDAGDLEECELHQWLLEHGAELAPEPGLYTAVKREHDPTSESFRSDATPWIFEPLEQLPRR